MTENDWEALDRQLERLEQVAERLRRTSIRLAIVMTIAMAATGIMVFLR